MIQTISLWTEAPGQDIFEASPARAPSDDLKLLGSTGCASMNCHYSFLIKRLYHLQHPSPPGPPPAFPGPRPCRHQEEQGHGVPSAQLDPSLARQGAREDGLLHEHDATEEVIILTEDEDVS